MRLPTGGPETSSSASWRQVFRLLSRRTPLWQEIALDLAGLPLVLTSFGPLKLFLPLPGTKDDSASYNIYKAYLTRAQFLDKGFLDWFRLVDVKMQRGAVVETKLRPPGDTFGVSLTFPFELLDVFAAAWALAFVPHTSPADLELTHTMKAALPVVVHAFWALLHSRLFGGQLEALLDAVTEELCWRGFSVSRRSTFVDHWRAKHLLGTAALRGSLEARVWAAVPTPAPVSPSVASHDQCLPLLLGLCTCHALLAT